MDKTTTAIRAIAGVFASKMLRLSTIVALLIAVPVGFLVGFLVVEISPWWLLLALPVWTLLALIAVVFVFAWWVVRRVTPVMNKHQRTEVRRFIDKFERVAGVAGTPKFFLFARVIRDSVSKQRFTYVRGLIDDSSSLASDFTRLQQEFAASRSEIDR